MYFVALKKKLGHTLTTGADFILPFLFFSTKTFSTGCLIIKALGIAKCIVFFQRKKLAENKKVRENGRL